MRGARLSKRDLMGGLLAVAAAPAAAWAQDPFGGLRGALDASAEGLAADSGDQSATLAQALRRAAAAGRPLFIPPGRYVVTGVELPQTAHLIGVPGETRLVFAGGPAAFSASGAARLRLEGLALEGGGLAVEHALVAAEAVDEVALEDCVFTGAGGSLVRLRACAGSVERCRFEAARTVGLHVSDSRGMRIAGNQVADCGDTGILVEREAKGADRSIVVENRVARIRADSGGTGQFGNGVNVAQAAGVLVKDNVIEDCAFSAIRCFSSDAVQISGNVASGSGEMAVYVEFAFEGAIVSGNLIDGAAGGVSFANFMEHGGRLAVCSGNIVRNIRGGPRYADGSPQSGAAIGAEADVAITGNVVEDAIQGLQLGWGPYLRDVAATGNVIRRTSIGIAVSVVEGGGPALIANNLISEASQGAILGMRWEEVASADLAESGAEAFPQLTIAGNRVT